jgi:hypothetical protein
MTTEHQELERRQTTDRWGDPWVHVIGPLGAVSFHGFTETEVTRRSGYRCAGLEIHYRKRPTYMSEREADFPMCDVIGGPCWCDGTSMYATEHLLPLMDALGVEGFWGFLEAEYRRRFSEREVLFAEANS